MTLEPEDLCRTKVLKLKPNQDALFRKPVELLRTGDLTVEQYQQEIARLLSSLDFNAEFADAIDAVRGQSAAEWLVRRHLGHRRYTIQVYGVADGEIHPPHHHNNLISTQIVLEGAIHLRIYNRVARNPRGQLMLRLVSDEILTPGQMFQVSEWACNAHWFGAVGGPALIFSVDARGFERKTFDTADVAAFGRRYLDPTGRNREGFIVCEDLDKEEAIRRFGQRPLSDFPHPSVEAGI